jgi:hypothetical protein
MSAQLQEVVSRVNIKVVAAVVTAVISAFAMSLFVAGSASALEPLEPVNPPGADCYYLYPYGTVCDS